ncbi:MAG: hypothetical protein KIS87_06025 [Phycisphaeraceae bacterium]|nr:hypothetical protein [Phycisphaeraceae bacterium]
MLTVKKLFEAMQGLDPDAQVVVGIINGPRFSAAYAEQQVCAAAEVDGNHRVTLRDTAAPALYLCCYEQPRPWEGQQPTVNEDGTATLRYDPNDPNPGEEA